jgi:hypothetical protein
VADLSVNGTAGPAAGRQHDPWLCRIARELLDLGNRCAGSPKLPFIFAGGNSNPVPEKLARSASQDVAARVTAAPNFDFQIVAISMGI